MKNHAYFSVSRPKDFITVFGPHVLQEFPHVKPKTATSVNVKPSRIVIQRVNSHQGSSPNTAGGGGSGTANDRSLKDIFFKADKEDSFSQ